jgi:hypothetical protein
MARGRRRRREKLKMASPEIERERERLRQDHVRVEGRPFEHFFCPVLFRDEPAKLCKGHVVNDKIPGSTKLWVVQREDVDNWYGKAFEGGMVAMVRSHDMTVLETLEDRSVSGRTDQSIIVDGESVPIYRDAGTPIPAHHSPFAIQEGEKVIPYVICKSPAELDNGDPAKWQIQLTFDCRLAGLVSILKAAHLSMFRLMGYSYALSASGVHIGKDLLGNFYLNNKEKRSRAIHKAGLEHFRQCVNMVRPAEYASDALKGTVEDGRIGVCFRSRGSPRGPLATS